MELKLGKVANAPIIVTGNLLVYATTLCVAFALRSGVFAGLKVLGATIVIAGCVLLHEIGHVLAAKHYGVRAESISLNFFGGIAEHDFRDWNKLMDRPKAAIVVWLCGPLVNLVLIALTVLISFFIHSSTILWIRNFNIVMAIFNLLPLYPLDGGGVLYSILRMKFSKATAISIASKISMIGAVLLILLSILTKNFMLGIISIGIFFTAKNSPKNPLFILNK